MIGTTLGQYRIESETGAGGMGVVYRAVDVDLKRPVAIKVLHADALADPDRKRRFVQEAQAASALNHPDIVTIYQIGSEGATDFIAMEFVNGRSLAEVIGGRPLPVADVLRYGARIAGALAAAHRADIVHRDLKPANVMVTEKSGIKLLDFGVAKLLEPTTSETALTGANAVQTRSGLVVGTFAYMSPEQARGEPVDARSDIYAFGVLLHEMLAGRRPLDVPALPPATPPDLQRIVSRCLQVDRDERFQSIDDVRMALQDVVLSPGASSAAPPPAARTWPTAALALAAVAAVVAASLVWSRAPAPAARAPLLTRLTVDPGLTTDPVLSPDGRFIAFASDRAGDGNLDIWVRQVAGGDAVRLTTNPADDTEPSFSPDGSHVAFRSERDGGGIYVTSALGGDERRIADQGRRPRWSPDGTQIIYWTGLNTAFLMTKADAARVFVVPAAGGEPRRMFAEFAAASMPIWSADGGRVLFVGIRTAGTTRDIDWWSAAADGTSPVRTGAYPLFSTDAQLVSPEGVFKPDAWTADGRVLFSGRRGDATNVWSVLVGGDGRVETEGRWSLDGLSWQERRFSIYQRHPVPPRQVTVGTAIETGATLDSAGTLALAALDINIDLWSLPLDPSTGTAAGAPQQLTPGPASDMYPWLSPDGQSLAFASNRSGTFDVWVRNLATGKDSLVAPRYSYPSLPTFTSDGLRITYQGTQRWRWLSVPVAGGPARTAAPQVICDQCESFWDLSSDGWAIFGTDDDTRIMARQVASGETVEMMRYPDQTMGRLRLSPDNRWIAFNNRESGAIRIVVVPFQPRTPVPRERWVPITDGDSVVNAPAWSADGRVLYYLSNRDGIGFCVWAQRLDPATSRPSGAPFAVWHFHDARRSMSRIQMGSRALSVSRDRVVVSVAESAGNIWLAK